MYRDIVKRFSIRDVSSIEDIATYLLSNIAREYSYGSLSRMTKTNSPVTVQKYLGYLTEAFLFFSLPRFSYKEKEQVRANKKCYCIDNGFVTARAIRFSEDRGRLYENLVAIELWKKELAGEIRFWYWKNEQQEEVDFVVKRGDRITALIQVCTDLHDERTRSREVRALLKAARDLHCDNLLILSEKEDRTEEHEWFGMRGTIWYVPLWKWFEGIGAQRSVADLL